MSNKTWNKCVVVDRVFICKTDNCNCYHKIETGTYAWCQHRKSFHAGCVTTLYKCTCHIANKEALDFLIDRCERDAKWAGLQLSIME